LKEHCSSVASILRKASERSGARLESSCTCRLQLERRRPRTRLPCRRLPAENDCARYTISKRAGKTVLRRLLELNFERRAEEAKVSMNKVEKYEVLAEKESG